jgi:predicted site-specific integrase-resolvase
VTIEIEGQIYYKTLEACKKTGISRPTLFRWLKLGILKKYYKNHRGWRLFTEEDLNIIRAEARKIRVEDSFQGGRDDRNQYQ